MNKGEEKTERRGRNEEGMKKKKKNRKERKTSFHKVYLNW